MTLPLQGVRVVEYAQYVAGPLCGVLLGDLGADVIKVEPPNGDGYRYVMQVSAGLGRYFVPLNRGKRSVVIDLKTEEGRRRSARLLVSADVVVHNFPPARARRLGLDWDDLHVKHPELVVGRISSFGTSGPLAGVPAYDLVAQAHAGLLTAHASPGDTVPVRAGGIPMADLAAGFLLATGVLAALVRSRTVGEGELVDVSLLAAAMAVQLQDLVWLEGEVEEAAGIADRHHLDARAAEIAGSVVRNPYYRCFEAADGFVAVACLSLAQRRAFLDLFERSDPTIEAPDLVPDDRDVLAGKHALTAAIADAFRARRAAEWLERLGAVGVPCSLVRPRETIHADPQVVAEHLIDEIDQPGLGAVRLFAPFIRVGGRTGTVSAAPELGADSDDVLAGLA